MGRSARALGCRALIGSCEADPGSNPSNEHLRHSLAHCALVAAQATLIDCFAALATELASAFIHLLVDVHAAQGMIRTKARAQKVRKVLDALSPEVAEIFKALAFRKKRPKGVAGSALTLLNESAATSEPVVLDKIVPVMIASGATPTAAIRRWLAETRSKDLAVAATEAAIAVGDEDLVWLARYHDRAERACVRRLTIWRPLWRIHFRPSCFGLVSDPGSRVRRGLVRARPSRPHADHLPILMRSIHDQWSDAEPQYNEPNSYPIARAKPWRRSWHMDPLLIHSSEDLLELGE